MADARLRKLDRRARAGDPDAAAELATLRTRHGLACVVERAHAAWIADEKREALELLLDLWRGVRAPVLADAIGTLTQEVARSRGEVPGKTQAERLEAWRRVASADDPFDVPRLLAGLSNLRLKHAHELFPIVEEWPLNPRVSEGIVSLLLAQPSSWYGQRLEPVLGRRCFQVLQRIGDPRAGAVLEPILARGEFVYYLDPEEEELSLGTETAPGLPEREEEALARFMAGLISPEDAFARVYADPEDDDLRWALARTLESRGDPQGEFIRLQLERGPDGKPSGKEKRLERAHWREWAKSLLEICGQGGLVFERGLPAVLADLDMRAVKPARVGPEWATIRRVLRVNGSTDLFDNLSWPPEIERASLELLERGLGCRLVGLIYLSREGLGRIFASPRSDTLRALQLQLLDEVLPPDLRPLWSAPLALPLEHVHLKVPGGQYVPGVTTGLWRWHTARPTTQELSALALRTFRLTRGGFEIVYWRDGEGGFSGLRIRMKLYQVLEKLQGLTLEQLGEDLRYVLVEGYGTEALAAEVEAHLGALVEHVQVAPT